MTLITLKDGKAVMRDGKIGSGNECCDCNCVYACYCHPGNGGVGWVVQDTPCQAGQNAECCTTGFPGMGCNYVIATTTINKPASLADSSVAVVISGYTDDDAAIDGQFVGPSCRPAGPFLYVFLMAAGDPSFELSMIDSYGVCTVAVLAICFTPCEGFEQPSLTITGSGTGAVFAPTLSQAQPNSSWGLESVTASGGSGYIDGEWLTISPSIGDIQIAPASARLFVGKAAPTLTLSGNATTTISTQLGADGTYSVSSVTVTNGGSGYSHGSPATLNLGTNDVQLSGAALTIVTNFEEPTLSASVGGGTGSGATLGAPVLEFNTNESDYDYWGLPYAWRVSSVPVTAAGAGYSVGDPVNITAVNGTQYSPAWTYVSSVDANGGVLEVALSFNWGGVYAKDTGVISSVRVDYGGSYYKDDPNSRSVIVTNPGAYYGCTTNPFP